MKLFPIIQTCFKENKSENNKTLIDILWILKHFTDFNNSTFNLILSMPDFDTIINYTLSANPKLAQVSLKIINNLLSGDNNQLQVLN